MTCVECTKNRSDQIRELICENKENCRKALDDFIITAEKERDELYIWDEDEYENGMKAGYNYCIEIARKLKK